MEDFFHPFHWKDNPVQLTFLVSQEILAQGPQAMVQQESKEKERWCQALKAPFKGSPTTTSLPFSNPHLLKVLPSLNSTRLPSFNP